MSISFSLNLTPNQIEFLQQLDLYAEGLIPITDIAFVGPGRDMFITWIRKLIREGLVEHVVPAEGQRYEGGRGGGEIVRAYKITDKGKTVLGLIEQDVNAFLQRQRSYQEQRRGRRRA